MFASIDAPPWSFFVRTAQAVIEASPTLVCGLLVTGVLRRMVGGEGMRRLFGRGGWNSLVRAWGLGMLLPVCSLGVIPIARELRRGGVSGATVIAFALAAPLINPLSLLYGLTLARPAVILCFAAASLVVSLVAGWWWERLFPGEAVDDNSPPEQLPPPGPRRLVSVVETAARELTGPSLRYWFVGLVGVGALALCLPNRSLQRTMQHNDATAPLLMTALAIPAYDPPLKAMMQVGLMFEHGNSVGAAFVLFILGAGMNLGTLALVAQAHGWRSTAIWLGPVVLVTLALAYASEPTLYFKEEPEDHTHAFDDFASPFELEAGNLSFQGVVWPRVKEKLQGFEVAGLMGLAGLALVNLALRSADRFWNVEAFLLRPNAALATKREWDLVIPGHILAIIGLTGLVVFGVVGAYVYYPPPEVVFREMHHVRAEALVAVISDKRQDAIRQLEDWDLLTRKLEVGVVLRTGRLSHESHQRAEELRDALEELRDRVLAKQMDEARGLQDKVEEIYYRCRATYLDAEREGVAHRTTARGSP
jgi:uncharacterized membrane protein YraQ (UPF0718 family)